MIKPRRRFGALLLSFGILASLQAPSLAAAVKIRYLQEGNAQDIPIWQKVVAEFERQNPDIDVELEVKAPHFDSLLTAMASGAAPDVFSLQEIQIMQLIPQGVLLELTPLARQDRSFREEDLFPIATLVARDAQGRLFGLPTAFSSLVWYYDKNLFDAAGLPYPDGSWRWDPVTGGDFLRIARALTRDLNGDGKIDQWGLLTPITWPRYLPFIVSNGGYYWDPTKTRSTITAPEFVDAVQFLGDLVNVHRVAAPLSVSGSIAEFLAGRVGLYYSGRWEVPAFRASRVDPNWDVTVPPAGPRGRAATVGAGYAAIWKGTRHPQAAWRLLTFLASETSYRIRDTAGQTIPPIRRLAFSTFFLDSTPPANNRAFLEVLEYGITIPLHPRWPDINRVVHPAIVSVLEGKSAARTALASVSSQVDAILAGR